MQSFEEKNFVAVADRVVCTLAKSGRIEPAIGEMHEPGGGLGLSGAENSVVLEAPMSFEEMRYAMAILGRYAHQKFVIVFAPGTAGSKGGAKVVTVHLPATAHGTLEKVLDTAQVTDRTLVDSRTVLKLLLPGESEEPIRLAARKLHGSVDERPGRAEILGDDDRGKAMSKYDRVIEEFETANPGRGLSEKLWSREWHDAEERTCTATAKP